MKKKLYFEAISQGWKISWRHKALWTYGLLAAFLGQMGIAELVGHLSNVSTGNFSSLSGFYYLDYFLKLFAGLWQGLTVANGVWLFLVALFLTAIAAAFFFVIIVAQGALVKSASLLYKKDKKLDFHATWHVGVKHFWSLAMVQFLRKTILLSLILATGAGALNAIYGHGALDNLFFVIIFVCVSVLGAVLSFLSIYTIGYIVVEEYHIFEAMKEAWKLFVEHWLVSLEIGAIMLLINLGLIVAGIVSALLLFSPAALLWAISMWTGKYILFSVGIVFSSVLTLLAAALLASVFTVFMNSVWIFLFMKMHSVGVSSKIIHWWKNSLI
jgi:hypothetical protein